MNSTNDIFLATNDIFGYKGHKKSLALNEQSEA
jgi:hypothetical protein